MSLIGEAETAIGAATGTGWVKIVLKIAPYLAIAGLLAALLLTRAALDRVKLQAANTVLTTQRDAAKQEAANNGRLATAADGYAQRTAALQPIILHSKDTVTTYAQTPAGRVSCLGADRVHGIDDLDATLFTPAAAAGSVGAVQPLTSTSPAGRINSQR